MSDSSPTQRCATCFFHLANISPDHNGICRRFPPRVLDLPGHPIGIAAYPLVFAQGWCGEWLRAEASPSPSDLPVEH